MSLPLPSKPTKPFQVSLRTMFAAMALVGVLVATECFGLVGFRYPRAIENDPLVCPVRVVAMQGDQLTLEDGRILKVTEWFWLKGLEEAVTKSDSQVDIEDYEPGKVVVYVKERGWICGTPYVRLINLPLIPVDVPINHRSEVGVATVGLQFASQRNVK